VPFGEEVVAEVGADEACTAGYQRRCHVHRR
jgi:hypothetical protein